MEKTSKSIIILLLLQFYMIAGVAQDKTIMILESGLPYTDTYWFYSGHGNALDEAQIKDQWKKIGISFLLHIPEMVGFSLWARTLASPTSLIFYNQNGLVTGLWINPLRTNILDIMILK